MFRSTAVHLQCSNVNKQAIQFSNKLRVTDFSQSEKNIYIDTVHHQCMFRLCIAKLMHRY